METPTTYQTPRRTHKSELALIRKAIGRLGTRMERPENASLRCLRSKLTSNTLPAIMEMWIEVMLQTNRQTLRGPFSVSPAPRH